MSNAVLSPAKNGWRGRLVTMVRGWVRRHPRPAVGIAAGAALVVVVLLVGGLRRGEAVDTALLAGVQRGRLVISITETGTIRAKDNYEVKCGVEGQSTITFLIPEGTQVKQGDLLVTLDSGDLEDRLTQQKLSYEDAKAGYARSVQEVDITKSKNDSNIAKAEQTLEFARMDLKKWLGTSAGGEESDQEAAKPGADTQVVTAERGQPGDVPGTPQETPEGTPGRDNQLVTEPTGQNGDLHRAQQDAQNNVRFAEEEKKRAENNYGYTEMLYKQNYVTKNELDADKLAAERQSAAYDMAVLDKALLEQYTWRKQEKALRSAVDEAQRELERQNSEATASLAQSSADLAKSQAQLALQEGRLNKVTEQLKNSKMYAPRAGMVVYPKAEPYRGQQQVMEVGATVRYQQILLQLPDLSELLVNTQVYESEVSKVKAGQQALIRVQALAQVLGEGQVPVLQGRVTKIGMLPDYGNRWLNPDQKTFNVSVSVTESRPQIVSQLKPEMSAEVTIILATLDDCLNVPVQAINKIGDHYLAYVLRRGTPTAVPVSVGMSNAVRAQILGGLDDGDQVLLYPPVEGEAQLANLGLPRTGVPTTEGGTEATTSTSEGATAAGSASQGTPAAGGPSGATPAAAPAAGPPAQGAGPAAGEGAPGGAPQQRQRPQGAEQASGGEQAPGGGQPAAALSAEQRQQLREQLQNASPEEQQRLREQLGGGRAPGGGGRRRGGGQPGGAPGGAGGAAGAGAAGGAAGGAGGAGTGQPQQ